MSEHSRQFFHCSRHLMGAVFTRRPFIRTGNHNDHSEKPYSIAPVEAARRQDLSEIFILIERIHLRLDMIEQKIDELLMPMDAVKH